MKPIIAVMPLYDYQRESLWMLPGYLDGIKEAGGNPIIISLNSSKEDLYQVLSICDGILLTGGHDVSPSIYNEKLTYTLETSLERDTLEGYAIDYALKNDIPLLGICRGIQFINAYLGGTLYQDLKKENKNLINHQMTYPYDRVFHNVTILKDTPLYNLLNKDEIGVNSYHHQAIKKLSDKLDIMAISADGIIEAVYIKNMKFFWAVQWHPEFSYKVDNNQLKIFEIFVKSAGNKYEI